MDEEQEAPPQSMSKNLERFLEIETELEGIAMRSKVLGEERTKLEKALTEQFAEIGIQNIKAAGKTVYIHRSTFCSVPGESQEQLVSVLDAQGMSDMAPRVIATTKVKALLNEDGERWGPLFEGLIYSGEKFSIRTRKAT